MAKESSSVGPGVEETLALDHSENSFVDGHIPAEPWTDPEGKNKTLIRHYG